MNKQRASAASVFGLILILAASIFWIFTQKKVARNISPTDEALLALIKNDLEAFKAYIQSGASVHDRLPLIDNKSYTVAQGVAYFERTSFASYLQESKIPFVKQDANASFDIMGLVVKNNLPELFAVVSLERPNFDLNYGPNGWTLLHMASAWCSHKIVTDLSAKGSISWETKAKDGSTPLTLAAENECLPVLSYFKARGADFRAKDGRGRSALAILHSKKDAALTAFAASFERRNAAMVKVVKEAAVPNFYKKRIIPKDQIVDHAAMLEPEDRPLEATETAENSEFAD